MKANPQLQCRLLLLLLSTLIASGTALAPQSAIAQNAGSDKKEVTQPFSIMISAPSTIKSGQAFNLHIRLTNLSDHPLDTPAAWMGAFDVVYGFDIRDSTGGLLTWHPPHTVIGIDSMQPGTLEPRQSKDEEVVITKFYDLTKPGTYTLQAKRYIAMENPSNGEGPKVDRTKGEIKSNVITIAVSSDVSSAP